MNRKTFLQTLAAAVLGLFFAISAFAQAAVPAEKAGDARVLVAYFSLTGNTKALAQSIAEKTGAKIVEIVPAEAYPTEYRKCTERAKKEIGAKAKPPLKALPADLAAFDIIFVGSPSWLGTYAPPVATFLDSPALAGKTLVPFFTNGGGGLQNCESTMKRQVGDKAFFLRAIAVNGKKVKDSGTAREVDAWLAEIGLGKK